MEDNSLRLHGKGHFLGMLRLALIPASRPSSRKGGAIRGPVRGDSHGAQHDKSEIFRQNETLPHFLPSPTKYVLAITISVDAVKRDF